MLELKLIKLTGLLHSIHSTKRLNMKQTLNKTHTDPGYVERSVFLEQVNNHNLWNFELGSQENMNVPIRIIIGFQQKDRQDSQNLINDSFVDCQLLLVNASSVPKQIQMQAYY